jgi:phage terminase large subunit-like protein
VAKKPTKTTTDRATAYALAVTSGKIAAGPIVRDACKRHISDLETAKERGFYFDKAEAAEAIAFFEEVLCLNGGQFEGKPFLLNGWQDFVVGNIYGWKRISDGFRRFRVVYIETPKGSGKSPLCAGMGHKGLVADDEPRAEVYAAATYKDQAMVLFRDALAFYDQSPELQSRLTASGTGANRWNLAYLEKGSFFRVISSEKKGQSGPRPHMALLDEIHEHRDGTVIEMLRAGFKFRRQPLSVMITNSGHDKTSVCWEYHELGRKVCAGLLQNDEFFAYICSLDEDDMKDDRYLTDETLWMKVNPSLKPKGNRNAEGELDEGIPGYDYIRQQVNEGLGMPSKMAQVKRLCFCQWVGADNPWISGEVWTSCKGDLLTDKRLVGRKCYGGLDLSSVQDLTSLVLLFEPCEEDPMWRLVPYFWVPGDDLKRKADKDHVPYDLWRDQEWLFALEGKAINKSSVVKKIAEINAKFDLVGIAYDRWKIKDLEEFAEKAGVELAIGEWDKDRKEWKFDNSSGIRMMPFGQEFKSMSPALDKFETMLTNTEVMHNGNPVMTWCAANTVVAEDEDKNRKASKRKSTGRIDGTVAAIMAAGIIGSKGEGSGYDERAARGEEVLRSL